MLTIHIEWPLERPYLAEVQSVIDGDTVRLDIDQGLRSALVNYKLRLAGCNAWEVDTEPGKAARDNLREMLPIGTRVILLTIKDYKYGGEFVARMILEDGTDLVAQLIAEQWAAPWNGRGAAPVPPWPRTV